MKTTRQLPQVKRSLPKCDDDFSPTQKRWQICIDCLRQKPTLFINLAYFITRRDQNAPWEAPFQPIHGGCCSHCNYSLEHFMLSEKVKERLKAYHKARWEVCDRCIKSGKCKKNFGGDKQLEKTFHQIVKAGLKTEMAWQGLSCCEECEGFFEHRRILYEFEDVSR